MRILFTVIVLVLLAGCSAYVPPTVVSSTTTPAAPTTPVTTVVVRGNVYVRDNSGEVQGWLEAGTTVEAACSGDWCYITGGCSLMDSNFGVAVRKTTRPGQAAPRQGNMLVTLRKDYDKTL